MVVYYDDLFKELFGQASDEKLEAIVAVADQLLSEKQSLGTLFEIETIAFQHAEGHKWETHEWMMIEESDCMKSCKTCESFGNCVKEAGCMQPFFPPSICSPNVNPPTFSEECQNCMMSDDAAQCNQCKFACVQAGEGLIVKGFVISNLDYEIHIFYQLSQYVMMKH